ncbi:MAG: hypothetical protein K1X78_07160 [Verrucomicrobiaceae bacterium]|nr:hypothetical protein [Verrucomicrobiaceae bacterium]
MNAIPTSDFSIRRWSVLLLAIMLAAFMHGDARAVPVWLVVVPFGLMVVEELGAKWGRMRAGGGSVGVPPLGGQESVRSSQGAGASSRASGPAKAGTPTGSFAQVVLSAVLFHGAVIATVVVGHYEAKESKFRIQGSNLTPALLGQSSSNLCGGSGCGTSAGCGNGGCGAGGGGQCSCGGGGSKSATTAKTKTKAKANVPAISEQEAKARVAAIQKRTMSLPASALPGMGPNGKPLPPGLQPRASALLPKGVTPTPASVPVAPASPVVVPAETGTELSPAPAKLPEQPFATGAPQKAAGGP